MSRRTNGTKCDLRLSIAIQCNQLAANCYRSGACMRSVLSILCFLVSATFGFAPPNETSPASQSASAPATQPSFSDKVDALVQLLGHRDYRTRESAQRQLAALGDAALPEMVRSINHDNPEISRRIQGLIRRPDDPALRIETVRQLIRTGDQSQIETAVYMLFKTPIVDYPRFKRITDGASGIERAMFEPICEQLSQWRQITERFEARQARLVVEKPDAARREREMHEGTYFYQAEAALWTAIEAAEDYRAARKTANASASTQPVKSQHSTSQPGR